MVERYDEDPDNPIVRTPAEGVRIIGAEEAAAALEGGQAAGRRTDNRPRYGDVPEAPEGPRPSHRFPSSEASDDDVSVDDVTTSAGLPHWTEPASGEVPKVLVDDDADTGRSAGPIWRDEHDDWEDDFEHASLADSTVQIGALADRSDEPQPFSFDEPEPPPTPIEEPVPGDPSPSPIGGPAQPTRTISSRGQAAPFDGESRNRPSRDISVASITGGAFALVALVAFNLGPAATLLIATAIAFLGALEIFDVLRRAGYRPATLLGLTAVVSIMFAAYSKGESALPLVMFLTFVFSLLWYLIGVVQSRPTINIAATLFGFVWVGLLASYGALLLRMPDRHGIAFVAGAVIATVVYDVAAYFVGSQVGRRPLMEQISPNKTWEGLIGGTLATLVVCVLVVKAISPWSASDVLWLWVVVSVMAPVGDLCESMIKRDLGLKDMGNILPGHGGILDRFDALLFVLPATYYLVQVLNIG